MSDSPAFPLKIFYDGACSVCASEMDVYRNKGQDDRLLFIDISAPDFDPIPYGISLDEFMYELHAIDSKNRIYRGVEAFSAIWQAFSPLSLYGLLGAMVMFPGVNPMARLGYWTFARLRKFLPKNYDACRDGTCRIGKDNPPR
jgi:predicted DCC family thiol-disulfide oxidoreductase YuxK